MTGRLASKVVVVTGGGSIVNNASIGGVRGIAGLPGYTAAKHGLVGLSLSAALENAGRGVRVNALVTGNADTRCCTGACLACPRTASCRNRRRTPRAGSRR